MRLVTPKDSLRHATTEARAGLTPERWAAEDERRTVNVLAHADGLPAGTVALYASRAGEPSTDEMIDGLVARGWRVLLPVIRGEVDWAEFTGWADMRPGWGAIPMPSGERLGAAALETADLVLVPCLGVGLDGSRLGTGGGWYDRALPHRRPGAAVIAIAREAEVHDALPVEPHDIPVDGFITEVRSAVG